MSKTVITIEEIDGGLDVTITGKRGTLATGFAHELIQGTARADVEPSWEPLRPVVVDPEQEAKAARMLDDAGIEEVPADFFENGLYFVQRREVMPGFLHLSIRAQDRSRPRLHDWRHFQQIKNELCGEDAEGVEVYPSEDRLADNADQYHLWVAMPDSPAHAGLRTIGYENRFVSTPEEAQAYAEAHGVTITQSPWAPGLTTGRPLGDRHVR